MKQGSGSKARNAKNFGGRPPAGASTRGAVPTQLPHSAIIGQRSAGIDALRGGALCLMFVYHFAFDLRFYRVIAADFEHDLFWLGLRALIVSTFMALVGISLVLADRAGAATTHFYRRIVVIGACALAVSVASWLLFPHSFIYFGILHCIAITSLVAWPLVRRPRTAIVAGCVIVMAGLVLSHPIFDARAFSWIGFATAKPVTEDYVPLAPWMGVALLGIGIGNALMNGIIRMPASLSTASLRDITPSLGKITPPHWLQWLGRHSLAVYMIHQPLLLGALWLAFGH